MTKQSKDWACPCGRLFGCKSEMYKHKQKDGTALCTSANNQFKRTKRLPINLNDKAYQNMKKQAERLRTSNDEKWYNAQSKEFKESALKKHSKWIEADLNNKTDW